MLTIGYLDTDGTAAAKAAGAFAETIHEPNAKGGIRIKKFLRKDAAIRSLLSKEIRYLALRDTALTAPLIQSIRDEAEHQGIDCKAVARTQVPVTYVVGAPQWCSVDNVKAVIMDDEGMSRTTMHREASLPSGVIRYGSVCGDSAAKCLKEQPGAYMHGTAVLCSADACKKARLHVVLQDMTDTGQENVEFVLLTI